MRRVTFGPRERIVLAPVEIVGQLKVAFVALVALAVLDVIRHHRLTPHVALDFLPFAAAILTGGLLVPLLLPWLPFRFFALKGAVAGVLVTAVLLVLLPMGLTEAVGVALLVVASTAYMGMMFTGSTTFTNQAGRSWRSGERCRPS